MKRFLISIALLLVIHCKVNAQICQVIITHMINGNQVQYFGSSPDNPSNWSWFFNGGSPLTSSQQNPVVTYANPGTYICALSVYGGPNNCSASVSNKQDTVTIVTTALPEAVIDEGITLSSAGSSPVFRISSLSNRTVTVQLYDINGRLIDTIFKGLLREGINTLQLEAYGLSGGNYILSVVGADNKVLTCKFHWNE